MHLPTMSSMIRCLPRSVGCLAGALALAVGAQPAAQTADRIKAAYVYNFAKFVEMTGTDDKSIRLCVLGKDDLNGAMLSLNRRMAQGREIVVRKDVPLDQIKDCAMAFVGENDARLLYAVARQVGNAQVLLVSDARQAMDLGAHLSLIFNDDRVEFDVNLLNLQKSNIKASSQMLKLARVVIR
ncbi:MAG: YfiR family protein [Limnohabitans sp.]